MEEFTQGAEVVAHVAMGLGLAACAGLRAFLPLFVVGLAGRLYDLPLSGSFEWLSSWPALIVFGVAVVAELLGDKFPIIDHFLDSFQMLVKPVAGALVMATVVTDWSPLYLTIVWIIAGGSVAGLVHATKAQLRIFSSATTAGLGNPALSVTEDVGAAAGSVLAILLPIFVAVFVVLALLLTWVVFRRFRLRGVAANQSAP